jgi:hypothetical protein
VTNGRGIAVKDLRVGDYVRYRTIDDAIVDTTVVRLVRDASAKLIGFYPARKSDLEPSVAVTTDRILLAWRPPAGVSTPT